ncbi:MAG: cytochrome c-type biogenesis protein CcmH [Pseudoxanthomonas sp.]
MNRTRARKSVLPALVLLVLLAMPAISFAQAGDPALPQFRDAAEETRFHRLTGELRCVMCQNQSLADSNAQIAHDLRREVLDLMHQGKSDDQIKQFLVERYGEFVLYRPQMEKRTWLLWFGPFALLLLGAAIVVRVLRRQARREVPDDDAQEW